RDEREREPDPPRPQPEMVIDHRRHRADDETDAEPDRLAFHEEIHVAMAVLRERARAEKHDDADDQHPQHSQEQEVSALAMHLGVVAAVPSRRRRFPARGDTRLYISLCHYSDFLVFFFSFGALFSFGAGITSFCPI